MDVPEWQVELLRDSEHFDEKWYLARYPDVAALGMDPIAHYLWLGAMLGRDPSPNFSTRGYLALNADVAAANANPLVHYLTQGLNENRPLIKANKYSLWIPPEDPYERQHSTDILRDKSARMVAFYLPQFHPIPENNAWWGEGFTEWTNVRPAKSQFAGHYQPHIPHEDIGYYSLNNVDTLRKQIDLAKIYGIEAFCFYYYWFGGKRLLEKPIDLFLENTSLDQSFCLCWANENWSRRWDGLDAEILIGQHHSPEDDLACIADLARYIRDPRYFRIDGKPLVLIYRPSLLPSIKETANRWRTWCRQNGIGEIFLAYTQSFEREDPTAYGFDAAIEFPPNNSAPPDLTGRVAPLNPDYAGKVYDWNVFVERSRNYADPGYPLFRSVCPGWDNTARRRGAGTAFVNNTARGYEEWLTNAIVDTRRRFEAPSKRVLFVNAWNEWAEGAHLEPDQRTGYAYLEATRRALEHTGRQGTGPSRRVVIVSHDAYRHGAQYLALNLARTCAVEFGYDVDMIVLGDGPLTAEFSEWATVHNLAGKDPQGPEAAALARQLLDKGANLAICNTTVSGKIVPTLKRAGFRIVSLIHELPEVILQYSLQDVTRQIAADADHVVFPANIVADGFERFAPIAPGKRIINPQGLYKLNPLGRDPQRRNDARASLRRRHGIDPNAPVVLGVGYADRRKGFDLFVEAGVKLLEKRPDARLIWLGADAEPAWMEQAKSAAVAAGVLDRFIMPGFDANSGIYYAGADVFALTSREDPFPSVVLESLDCGLPVVGFAGTGGMGDVIDRAGGINVPAFDVAAMANALQKAIEDRSMQEAARRTGPALIDRQFIFRRYVHDLLSYDADPIPRVSVVVPNYNYAGYIGKRLDSIRDQTLPVYELIVLDDCSTDNSVQRIRETVRGYSIPTIIHENERNSGSVFKQWQLGVGMARGDFVWIAEADDLAEPGFLAGLLPAFSDPEVVLSYCQSRQIDSDGTVLSENYLDYVADLGAERWTRPYVAKALDEIRSALFLKNVIPNVSAVVFRRKEISDVLTEHEREILSYRNAGDWVAYIRLHERGAFAFNPTTLNSHRRHQSSVTIGNSNRRHLDEIIKVQADTIARFRLGPAATKQASDYAGRIAVQFGLA